MLLRRTVVVLLSCSLVGCAAPIYQQTQAAPPSVSEIQGGCFASREKFLDQAACIQTALSSSALNPYAQEYLAYMQSLATKVKAGKLSGEDARVKLTAKHNELRARQQNELAAQEQLDNQRTMQAYELLKQNNYKLEMPTVAPVHSSPTQTDCYKIGEQLHCTTR